MVAGISPGSTAYLNRNRADSAYAGYVFTLILRAVEQLADANSIRLRSAQSGSNQGPAVFVIRGAPGAIYSKAQDFGYAKFSYKGEVFEIHLGVQFRGSSEVLHEFGWALILSAKDADESRKKDEPPGPGQALRHFWRKLYTENLGIELGREFVGLRSDFLTSAPIVRPVTNSDSDSVEVDF